MSRGDGGYLNRLDQQIYSLRPSQTDVSRTAGDSVMLISAALRLLNMPNKRLDRVEGDILTCLNFNNIYYRTVSLPGDLEKGEYPLLVIHKADDRKPYLLYRDGQKNSLMTIRDGRTIQITKTPWPVFADSAQELHRSFRDQIDGVTEIARLAYQPELGAIGLLLLISVIVLGFSLSIPILTNTLVSSVLPQSDLWWLAESLLVVAMVVVASITSQYLQGLMILRLETIGNQRLQIGVWEHFLKLPTGFTADHSKGEIYVGLSAISKIRSYIGAGALTSALSALFSFAFLALMIKYSPGLAVWMVLVVMVALLVVFQIARQSIELNEEVFELKAELNTMSNEISSNAFAIRSMSAEIPMLQRWMQRYTTMANISLKLDGLEQAIDVILLFLSPLGSVVLFAVAVAQVLNSPQSIGDPKLVGSFIAFYSAFTAFTGSVAGAASNLTTVFATVSVLWKKARMILDEPIEQGWRVDAINHVFEGEISLRDVRIQPSGLRSPLLNKISLTVDIGKILVIAGQRASGKSLLLKTMIGMTTPDLGEVLIDSTPITKISIRGLRRQVGYLPQEIVLETLCLRDLLREHRDDSDDMLWAMLQDVGLHERIRALPQQLNTQLDGEKEPLNSAECKLLALARALLRQPSALLLDEFLVGIPKEAHADLLALIQKQGCTTVLVASHESELEIANTIVLLEDGRIACQGKLGSPGLERNVFDLD
ncbi:ATP-binding cassette domain-containing protein [Synechococcus sp. UW179A]|uniref:ATP-binding cassette domain-containing protein n=1 Tax=Synechococcus sp. UW179A TaxID=2575510 RepID=UPI000E0F8935|nr:ATP-binding cassette domain-containing protein [Synechococcus sp. UW179A]